MNWKVIAARIAAKAALKVTKRVYQWAEKKLSDGRKSWPED